MWAIGNKKLYRIVKGEPRRLVSLGKFEKNVNPDGADIDSNPFDVTALGSKRALIADAGANTVLDREQARWAGLDRHVAG